MCNPRVYPALYSALHDEVGEKPQQPSEEAVDVVGKQRAWGDVNVRDITTNKTGLTDAMEYGNVCGMALCGKLSDPFWAIGMAGRRSEMPVHYCMQHREQAGGIRSLCAYGARTSVVSQRSGRIAHMNGVLCGWIQALQEGQAKKAR